MNQKAAREPIPYAGTCSHFDLLDKPQLGRNDCCNEHQLPDLDAGIEKQESQGDIRLRKPDLRESAGKAESVQQTETEGHQPGRPGS